MKDQAIAVYLILSGAAPAVVHKVTSMGEKVTFCVCIHSGPKGSLMQFGPGGSQLYFWTERFGGA